MSKVLKSATLGALTRTPMHLDLMGSMTFVRLEHTSTSLHCAL